MAKNSWIHETEHPDVLNPSGCGFSVDVLAYSKRLNIHSIAWFDFAKMEWIFLANEHVREFQWRYFTENDKPQ